ncbi:lipopolysaccharide biosynthesis protein [Erythrobacter sp. JK5]|uniref:lipopolysaccharide biosynthesis protein n=1 Tax=Erythrobacter sp. JK5 TaxID=2829500 RepID=UPI001BAA1FE7|nr:polysaccharide biosynthesis C-terminal domain-containing protein [Erythrobacter sp. JK5]QUL37665.1 polysaccharide biosynthesis C-terminal domain-containing protein [Erythrobacter sp. JK5]
MEEGTAQQPGRLPRRGLHFELLLGLMLRIAGAAAAFAMTWVIARLFGAQTFGQFQLALATATITALVAAQGLDRLIVRSASAAFAKEQAGAAFDFFAQARNRQLLVSIPLAIAVFLIADPVAVQLLGEPGVADHLRWLAPTIVAFPLIRASSSLLRAKGSVLVSQSLDGVGYTSIAILALAALWLLGAALVPVTPSVAYLAGVVLVALVSVAVVRAAMAGVEREPGTAALATGLFIAAFNVLAALGDWLGLFLLTAFRDAAEAGIYRVGFQVCLLFTLVNSSFSLMAGPRLATAFDRQDPAAAWKTVRASSLLGIAIVVPLLLVVLLAAEWILSLFGPDFVRGADALRILALGQFFNVAAGPAGAALTMMNRERAVLTIEIATVAVSLALLLWLLPSYGMIGAAIGAAAGAVLRNAASLVVLRRLLAAL